MTRQVVKITREKSVSDAVRMMIDNDHGMIVVVDDLARHILGVLTDNDVLRKILYEKRDLERTQVQDIMSKQIFTIGSEKTLSSAADLMRKTKVKRLPVVDNERLVGVISSTDIMRSMVGTKRELLDMALEF